MKLKNIIFPMLAGSLALTGCYDEKMDWHTPEGHNPVTSDEIPLQLQEQIDHYDNIKNYMAQYMPETPIGLGLTADYYIDADEEHPTYDSLCNVHFQQFVTGNAMKMEAIVQNDGSLNLATVDAFLAKVPADKQLFGHNFIWHAQQSQAYLRSLIAPTQAQFIIGGIATQLLNDSYNFDGGTRGNWGVTGDERVNMSVEEGGGQDGSDCIKLEVLDPGEAHQVQFYYDLSENLDPNKTYKVSFKVRSSIEGGYIQFQIQNSSTYGSQQWGPEITDLGTGWTEYEWVFTPSYADDNRIICNLGKVASTYYIDDIVFGEKLYDDDSHDVLPGSGINYTLKTVKQKRQALLGAMKSWIVGMLQHVSADKRFVGWDVINEPITDDGHFRGIDNNFGGYEEDDNGKRTYDTKPVEDETNGLTLNWVNNNFYWGYYLGMDYAVQAFKLARHYAPAGMKLYVNDYGLESNPNKLAKLIKFVNYIDQNGGQTLVDGIATQMHVTASSITKEQVDRMFQTMVATGKLVRVSELDVALGTASPTEEDLQLQSDVYKMIIESYKENVPENLRGGFVIWTLSDAADEHKYWIPNDAPNLFDANYERKLAYKGLCDGIAGYDIGSEFTGDMWKEGVTVDDDGTTGDEGTTEGGEGSATEGE